MERQIVGGLQQLVEAPQLHVGRSATAGDTNGSKACDLHPEGPAAGRHLAADPPEADHAEPLAEELDAGEGLAVPLPAFIATVGGGEVAREGEHEGDGQLGGRRRGCRPGEFMTRTPRRVAAARSTLSTPTPARPITFRFFAASITSAFIWLPLRTRIAS